MARSLGRGLLGGGGAFFLGLQEGALLQLAEGLAQLLLRVHHDGAVPGHWLLERLAGDQQEADTVFSRLYHQLIVQDRNSKNEEGIGRVK